MWHQHVYLALIAAPLLAIAILLFWKPRAPQPDAAVLDIGGMALVEVLRRLDEGISELDKSTEGSGKMAQDVVIMARSARQAYMQSVAWRKQMKMTPDPLLTRSLSECLLDSLKLMNMGSSEWMQLKAELDRFHAHILSAGSVAPGGSTPPLPDPTAA